MCIRDRHIEELESMAQNEISNKANGDVLLDFDDRDDAMNTSTGMLNASATLGDLDDLFDFGPSEDTTKTNMNGSKTVQGLKELKLGHNSDDISSNGKNNPPISDNNLVSQDLLDLF